jgi:hypothetical protein
MHKTTSAALATAVAALNLCAQGPVNIIAPASSPDPVVNTTVITDDGAGHLVSKIQQCEVRSIGAGQYRVAASVQFWDPTHTSTLSETNLITGTLVLVTSPPIWAPNQDVAALNQTSTTVDEYQLSISSDGLNAVWDSYVPRTYPNSGAASTTFCCHRASTAVPFAAANVRAITGVGAGGVDPHIGEELANGHVILYHIDFVFTGNAIVKGDLDPATGILGPTTTAAQYNAPGAGFNHSPFVHRDSSGKARAMNYSEYPATTPQNSSAFFTEGVDNDGTPERVVDGGALLHWFNNPGLVGGSWHYSTSAQSEPWSQEVTMIANSDLTSGSGSIVAWSPVRPVTGSGVFISVVGIGIDVTSVGAPPYQLPPVMNDIWIFPNVGVLPIAFHDQYNGIAEWPLTGVPALNLTFAMQLVTFDGATGNIMASNTSYVRL